ncbi:MAG: LysM peptidoglycan-binding domain-containing protein [Actinomycetaceae bacterium]|nr:LysM peptidoglycan-binding domain-containing protein [Actinomycetaceae bacterium]
MSALQIQPQPLVRPVPARPSHLYVVPDLDETQTSAGSASLRTPKATAGLAGTLRTVVAFILFVAVMAGIGAGLGIIAQDTPSIEATTITSVQAGDSLWSIAAGLGIEDRSLEDVVFDIRTLNQLESSVLTPGQILTVPTK